MSQETMEAKYVAPAVIQQCLACAVSEGDIVNFRFLFMPASPLRPDSPEDPDAPKYAYLFPLDDSCPRYCQALELIQRPDMFDYISRQLERQGPPQLPWELVLALADNAVRLKKYTAAAQAYELLRIRRRMQELMLDKADALLERKDGLDAAACAYLTASALSYDYAAFPEPLPAVPNYQERALLLHSVYPNTPEQAIAMQPTPLLVQEALKYLLLNADAMGRLETLPEDKKVAFLVRLIRQGDPGWDDFAAAYREAAAIVTRHREVLERINSYSREALGLLYEQLLDSAQMDELRKIPAILLGLSDAQLEWWQCLKTLSYHHPAAALFVARQRLSEKEEVLVPRCPADSKLAQELHLI